MKIIKYALIALLTLSASCLNIGNESRIQLVDRTSYSEYCAEVKTNSARKVRNIPDTVYISEGSSVTVTGFPSTGADSTNTIKKSFTTRITETCEEEVTYFVYMYDTYIDVEDNYTGARDLQCDEDEEASTTQ